MKYSSVQKRAFAKFLDLMVVIIFGLLWSGGPGSVIGFLYSLTADGMPFKSMRGQSIGKKLMGLKVMNDYGAGTLKTSVIRNAPVGLVTFFMIIPFWGWILSLIIGIPLALIEISLIVRADRHQRLGDVMAETVVVDAPRNASRTTHGTALPSHSDQEPTVL